MQFSILPFFAALLATSTRASLTVDPLILPRANASQVTISVAGEQLDPDVSLSCIFNCATVLAEAACIIAAIATNQEEAVIGCVGIGRICKCSECVPGLKGFVEKHKLCD